MKDYKKIKSHLKNLAVASNSAPAQFFKTAPGGYAEHDRFIGVSVPELRKIAKDFSTLSMPELLLLLKSPINEERLLALIIKCNQYKKGNLKQCEVLYKSYLKHLKYVNNWNLVDSSAHLIVGAYLLNNNKDKTILSTLAKSEDLWERRIAIVSTWYFIRHYQFDWTIKIAKILLKDSEDLIHKAVGWMLREMGKKDEKVLADFLAQHATLMPRTMLRYAIEKFSPKQRKAYLEKANRR
jgi:3-methyladenine DNA glycosylase AlkD